MWDVRTGKIRRYSWIGHRGAIYRIPMTPTGTVLAAGDREGVVRIWDPEGRADPCTS